MPRLLLFLIVLLPLTALAGFDFDKALKDALKQATQPPPTQQSAAPTPPQGTPPPPRESTASILFGLLRTVSLQEEVAIGRQISGNLLDAAKLVDDATLQAYVNAVGRWVALQSERPDIPWRFGVIESDDINAFAAPGGFVFVTKGLYRQLDSEAELAGVLGHEIGHVVRQHHLNVLQQSKLIDLAGRKFSKKVSDGNEAVQNLIGNGAEIMARGLDKDAEYEADRIGMVLAARAGYDPWGLPVVLQDIGKVSGGSVALLFKTHPHPDDRLAHLSDAVGDRLDGIEGQRFESRLYRLK
jgi:predicted Zn-dependent protease